MALGCQSNNYMLLSSYHYRISGNGKVIRAVDLGLDHSHCSVHNLIHATRMVIEDDYSSRVPRGSGKFRVLRGHDDCRNRNVCRGIGCRICDILSIVPYRIDSSDTGNVGIQIDGYSQSGDYVIDDCDCRTHSGNGCEKDIRRLIEWLD